MEEQVIVLNADYTPINVVKLRRAINLLIKERAVVVEATKRIIMNAERTISILVPKVVRLVELVKTFGRFVIKWSKKNVLLRDGYTCVYCGKEDQHLTIDHVVPRALKGKTNFENTVAACPECNAKKADRTLEQAQMFLKRKPHRPSLMEFIILKMKRLGVYEEVEVILNKEAANA